MSNRVLLLDVCGGNLRSVQRSLIAAGADVTVGTSADDIEQATKIVVPGQGTFAAFVQALDRNGLRDALIDYCNSGLPYFGICLGLQVLFGRSEEAPLASGLGILGGDIRRLASGDQVKIPHMGWNQVALRDHAMAKAIPSQSYFYFVHSYAAYPDNPDIVVGTSLHGERFCAAIGSGNIYATQFHPEKSHDLGITMLRNFVHGEQYEDLPSN